MNTTNHTSPSGEDAANGAISDTGNAEADRIINRLSSSDPEFDDCIDAVAFIRKLVAEHKGPEGFATWKDAALDERHRRLAAEKSLRDTSKELICAVAEQSVEQVAANGAIGERPIDEEDAFQEWWETRKGQETNAYHGWMARAALTAEKVAAEPVAPTLYQYRTKPTWTGGKWSAWIDCSAEQASKYRRVPLLHDWVYEVRELFQHAPAAQPAQTQVALTDDARECLADVVSHYRALYAGLAFQLNEATVTENADDMAYWKHEIKALERMYAQAERALLASQPVSGGKS